MEYRVNPIGWGALHGFQQVATVGIEGGEIEQRRLQSRCDFLKEAIANTRLHLFLTPPLTPHFPKAAKKLPKRH